jgi:5' nucleotidase, deoxy (Pyrimidine), cytosolic type C protein (NT5C)
MKFGLDIDGVLASFGAHWTDTINKIWPGKLPEGYQPSDWNYTGVLTKEECEESWVRIKATPYFWEELPELPGIWELQDYLIDEAKKNTDPSHPRERDEIFFITARATTVGDPPMAQSAAWLSRRSVWPRNGFSTIISVADAKHKKDLFQALGVKFMLDDYAPTVQQLNEIKDMHAFVLDQPWNQYATELPRVFSVKEYLETIKKLSQ